jgi:hypothetical protein
MVPAGESLFVAIEMHWEDLGLGATGDPHNLLRVCTDTATTEGNWWTDDLSAPFTWVALNAHTWGDSTVRVAVETDMQPSLRVAFPLWLVTTTNDAGPPLFSAQVTPPPQQWKHVPSCSASNNFAAVRWTAPQSGNYTFHTFDSQIPDTVLVVLDAVGYQELACADDAVPGTPSRASIDRYVAAGETLTLMIGGDNDLQGMVALDIIRH